MNYRAHTEKWGAGLAKAAPGVFECVQTRAGGLLMRLIGGALKDERESWVENQQRQPKKMH